MAAVASVLIDVLVSMAIRVADAKQVSMSFRPVVLFKNPDVKYVFFLQITEPGHVIL